MSEPYQDCINKAQAAASARAWPDAERWFSEAARLQPASPAAQRGLGVALVSQQKFVAAEAAWRAAVRLAPSSADSHQMLGSVLMARRVTDETVNIDEAVTHLTRALELNPRLAEAAFNLGRIAYVQENVGRAAECFRHAAAANPLHIKAIACLMQTLMELRKAPEAITIGEESIARFEAQPTFAPLSYNMIRAHLAQAYRMTDNLPAAAVCYRKIVAVDPNDKGAAHLLAAAEGDLTQAHGSAFAKASFDALAAGFDHHLVDHLKYRAPTVLANTLHELRADADSFPAVLDLGCGTGLIGAALVQKFKIEKLVGVDFSANMLTEAQKRGLYAELVNDDVVSAMAARADAFDLIVAADVFIYVGALELVFEQAARLLKAGGMFLFTVEVSRTADLELESAGHYRHGQAYVERLAAAQGFTMTRLDEQPIRVEVNRDVMGLYVYLTKP